MSRQVALADNADDAVAVIHYGNSTNLVARHHTHAVYDRVVDMAGECLVCHAVVYARPAYVYTARDKSDGDVPVSDHANQLATIAVDNGKCAL